MRANKNTFTIFAVLLIALVLFCVTRSEGFASVPAWDGFASAPGFAAAKRAVKKVSQMPMGQKGPG